MTNVFAYAFDSSDPRRGPAAAALVDRLAEQECVLVWQVACELGAVIEKLRRRGATTLDPAHAVRTVRARFPLLLPDAGVLDLAGDLRRGHAVSYWDALLFAACIRGGVTRLYTEDMPGLQSVTGLELINPFA